ncbi:alpha/beta hydrolase family protein [Spirillospora sp. CA-142024]|uniref:alpha/beta hydrolase family protein n=1 Tax=Spirillospora sp. CA-142024 TaxID=3240036 RepID=UPI003D8D0D98
MPGILILPRGGGLPGVVLLSGGGPFDRDATSGPNKPLKDIAWGLAARGVAVARFDKVTYAHGVQVDSVADEYVPPAVDAVRLLQREPAVGRVFVLGHSMGGRAAPRAAAAEPSVADDHLFFPGEGPSTPGQCEQPRHVDPAVIADVAAWLHR